MTGAMISRPAAAALLCCLWAAPLFAEETAAQETVAQAPRVPALGNADAVMAARAADAAAAAEARRAAERIAALEFENRGLREELESTQSALATAEEDLARHQRQSDAELAEAERSLAAVRGELNEVRRISGRSLALDEANRKFAETVEMLRAQVDLLEAENLRLQNKDKRRAFLNGVFAVCAGAVITLLASKLWPRRRRNQQPWN